MKKRVFLQSLMGLPLLGRVSSAVSASSVFCIAMISLETGPFSDLGKKEVMVARRAIEEINQAGGILGHTLELKTYDCRGVVSEAQRFAKEISQTNCLAVILPSDSASALAAAEILENAQFPCVATMARNPYLNIDRKGHVRPWVFRLNLDTVSLGIAAGRFATSKSYRRVVALLNQDNQEELSFAKAFSDSFKLAGVREFVSVYYPGDSFSLWNHLALVENQLPDAVLFPAYGDLQLVGMLQFFDKKLKSDLIVWDDYYKVPYWSDNMNVLNRTYSVGVIDRSSDTVKTWIDQLGLDYTYLDASFTYYAVKLIAYSFHLAGTTHRNEIRKQLEQIHHFQWIGRKPLTMSAWHQPKEPEVFFFKASEQLDQPPVGGIDRCLPWSEC